MYVCVMYRKEGKANEFFSICILQEYSVIEDEPCFSCGVSNLLKYSLKITSGAEDKMFKLVQYSVHLLCVTSLTGSDCTNKSQNTEKYIVQPLQADVELLSLSF